MTTPIYSFVRRYIDSRPARLHMPGHKGSPLLGCEPLDLTEIDGADDLYHPRGIILESQQNAAGLFGSAATLYSTGGSSQSIRAMLYLAVMAHKERSPGLRPVVIAGRNAHKAFITAAALLDFEVRWLYPEGREYSLCRCDISPESLRRALTLFPDAAAVYVTSPDYLGNTAGIAALAEVSHTFGVPLLVDNAHGAYLRFLPRSRHPLDLGADLCCDSAHKTLPALTGAGYLHVSKSAPAGFAAGAARAMAMFGSTSPSYLILQSLDLCNRYLSEGYPEKLLATVRDLDGLKSRLAQKGWSLAGDEPMKLTLNTQPRGYTGPELAYILKAQNIHCEYADPDHLVLMPSPETPAEDLGRLEAVLEGLPPKPPLPGLTQGFLPPDRAMAIREALFSPSESVAVGEAVGRIAAGLSASCPPAVAPVVPGEIITEETIEIYKYYGIEAVDVVK